MGDFAYADNIVILAPTKYALRAILKMVNEFSRQYEWYFKFPIFNEFVLLKSECFIFIAYVRYESTHKMEFHDEVLAK